MIVLDIETTGLNPLKHSIVEIGALDFSNPENQFYQKCQIWEGAEIDPFALKINGYSESQCQDLNKASLEQILINFIDWLDEIEDRTIAGHNVDFDISFLKASIKRYNIDYNFGFRKVDQHSLIYAHHLKFNKKPSLKNHLSNLGGDKIMEYVGLPTEPKPHSGINGAKFEAEAMSRLIYSKNLLVEFNSFEIPGYLIN
tara:strand:+ start:1956 stop:2552 length:597 start_codon:yes stop_codon:yes gene_type:complete